MIFIETLLSVSSEPFLENLWELYYLYPLSPLLDYLWELLLSVFSTPSPGKFMWTLLFVSTWTFLGTLSSVPSEPSTGYFWGLYYLYPLSPLLDFYGNSIICILWAPPGLFMGTLLFVSSELLLDYLSVFSKPPPEILMGTLLFVSSEPRPGIYLGTLLLVYSEPSCNISGNSIICILWASSLNISGDSLICILWALS